MPRSGSTYHNLGHRFARAARGVTSGVGAERRHRGERLTAVARLLSVARHEQVHEPPAYPRTVFAFP
jgi:hypothetical protein